MYFTFAECLQAITACGCDIDAAISWLCERPVDRDSDSISSVGNEGSSGSSRVTRNASKLPDHSKTSVEAELQKMMEAAAKARKDADHKEELRRINRAWNARAEGEKKRLEIERRAKEVEKQHKTLAAQKLTQTSASQSVDKSRLDYVPQFYPNSAYIGRSVTQPKLAMNESAQGLINNNSFSVIQQQYFPPLGSNDSLQMGMTQAHEIDEQEEGLQQQPLFSGQISRACYDSALVGQNPELSADGLNKGAREFVPKFATTQSPYNIQNNVTIQFPDPNQQGNPEH